MPFPVDDGPGLVTATLRLVLDQISSESDPELREISRELGRALVRTAPAGCEVEAIVPAGADLRALASAVPGLASVRKAGLPRRELAASWQMGVAPGIGGGMIHTPSLMAPLVRHDRAHDNDQTVVTLWDLRAWERPDTLPRSAVTWHKAMLRRAEKHADSIVVPTHAMAARVGALGRFGRRIRVIAGAPPEGFAVPNDAVGRRRTLGIPEGTVVIADPTDAADAFSAVANVGLDMPVVLLDARDEQHDALIAQAAPAGLSQGRVHVPQLLDRADRAAVLDGALAFIATARAPGFPWRAVEALSLGVPVIAVASDDHVEVLGDAAVFADDAATLGDALAAALASPSAHDRLAVLASDRGRAFSWREHADRVWALHADL